MQDNTQDVNKGISDNFGIFPIQLRPMTKQETKDYYWNQLVSKLPKSNNNDPEPNIHNGNGEAKEEYSLITVSQALRYHTGKYRVKGTITSLTSVFKMITSVEYECSNCNILQNIKLPEPVFSVKASKKCPSCSELSYLVRKDYINTICVELQDRDTINDLERLSVFMFDKDTQNIRVGENTIIKSQIKIQETGKNKKLFSCLHAESIQYEKNETVALTERDIDAIKRFTYKHGSKIIDELVKMFDPSVIGYENVKMGLLFSAVNSNADSMIFDSEFNHQRQRIHSLAMGERGLAKSKLLRSAVRLVPRSRFESGTGSSGKSMIAIVEKDDDHHILRSGPIPLARNAICAINEFGRTPYEDQAHFLDVMEEGITSITKYGINIKINAPTTIIASGNPLGNSDWNDDDKIDINEIPALKPILDRFDLWFIFRRNKTECSIREYAYKKANLLSNKPPNYTEYLIKHIEYAKRLNPTINNEALNMLTEFFIPVSFKGFGSNRVFESLCRLIKAVARLKLKQVADEDDAKQVMSFYNVMLQNLQMTVNVSKNPKDVTREEFIRILKNTQTGMTVYELCKTASENIQQIKAYLKDKWHIDKNIELRRIIDQIVNNSNIKKIGSKPMVLQFLSDHSDLSDHKDIESDNGIKEYDDSITISTEKNTDLSSQNIRSDRSDRSDGNPEKIECPICHEIDYPYYISRHKHEETMK